MSFRKDLEERRRQDELAAAKVFEEFIETFHPTEKASVSKTWIKAGVINPNTPVVEDETNKIYKPVSKFQNLKNVNVVSAQEIARILPYHESRNDGASKGNKKKSNLELFKEELEILHKDREERLKYKEDLKQFTKSEKISDVPFLSETGDPNSTNLYVNNLSTKISEINLMELFGKYGPLASVKIMWPRNDEERNRNKNCGFVAYMSRKDAERGLNNLNGKMIFDCELRVGWGKTVLLPTHPVYIPKSLLDVFQPSPPSGLPFNAQPPVQSSNDELQPMENVKLEDCVVKVVLPTDRNLLALIHRTIEFVIREGMIFEAIIMKKEQHNATFRFLFDNKCPAHVYYRWKLYSILHGDSVREWRSAEFRMYKVGPIWKPPVVPNYYNGMPDELFESADKNKLLKMKRRLSKAQRDYLESLLHKLTCERSSIENAMIFCLQHKDASEEIVDTVTQSVLHNSNNIFKILPRIYLTYDLIYNSKYIKGDPFGRLIEMQLPLIMQHLSRCTEVLPYNQQQILHYKIHRMFKGMLYYNLYTNSCIMELYNIFMKQSDNKEQTPVPTSPATEITYSEDNEKIVATLLKEKKFVEITKLPGFIPCKWETINPDVVESQAMTTSKWNQLVEPYESDNDEDGNKPEKSPEKTATILSEEKRKKLREIEVRVMEYQDELEREESHQKVQEKVDKYRKKLIKQYEQESKKSSKKKDYGDSDSPKRKSRKCWKFY